MGQRSQIIVRVPRLKYSQEDNPNNRDEGFLLFHNQWLYGWSFVEHTVDIMEAFETIKNDGYQSSYPDYFEMISNAIKCANYKHPDRIKRTQRYMEDPNCRDSDNKWILKSKDWSGVMDWCDNNNGFIFLYITDKGEILYDLVNGLEDGETRERQTPENYIKLFYDWNEVEKEDVKHFKSIISRILNFNRKDYRTIEFPRKVK